MEERRINNISDNLDDNTKALYEILIKLGHIKSKLCGEMPIGEQCKQTENMSEEYMNTLGYKIGNQTGIITDILEEARRIEKIV